MAKFRKRWTLGQEVWECDQCHSINLSGKTCKCGRVYGAQLQEHAKEEKKQEQQQPKERHRLREPASKGTFIKSYYFPKEKEK